MCRSVTTKPGVESTLRCDDVTHTSLYGVLHKTLVSWSVGQPQVTWSSWSTEREGMNFSTIGLITGHNHTMTDTLYLYPTLTCPPPHTKSWSTHGDVGF